MSQGRYSRQELFQAIGTSGQEKLRNARIAIVGMGALGTISATQLVRAGVGYVRLIDRDIIEHSNLQRQSLYDESDAEAGRAKAETAANILRMANKDVTIDYVIADVHATNAESLLTDVDVIVDGTDNYQVRYLINDISVKYGIPWSYGGAVSSYGTSAFFRPAKDTPCFVCVVGKNAGGGQETCETVGVIAPIVSIIASIQVSDTLKYLTGNHSELTNGLTHIDVWHNQFHIVQFGAKSNDCTCCCDHQFEALASTSTDLAVSMCGRQTVQVRPRVDFHTTLEDVAKRLSSLGTVRLNRDLLQCDFGEARITLFADGRALFHGVDDIQRARELYAKYLGM